MVQLKIHVDDAALRTALKAAPQEIARAVRNAMNDTLRDVQAAQRQRVTEVFYLTKKSYITQSIKIPKEGGFATKDTARGEVLVDPTRPTLTWHESGGDRGSEKGSRTVAIPSREIRTGKGGQVKRGTALNNFLPFAMASALHQRHAKPKLIGQKGSFFIKTKGGDPMLVRRTGKGKALQGLWLWFPRERIKPALEFHVTAVRIIPSSWEKNVTLAIEHALRRAGLA